MSEYSEAKKVSLLIVDDDHNLIYSLKRQFHRSSYQLYTAFNARDGILLLEDNKIDIIISDYRMPIVDGVDFFQEVTQRWPNIARILLTGYAQHEKIVNAVSNGDAHFILTKPYDEFTLYEVIKMGIKMVNKEQGCQGYGSS